MGLSGTPNLLFAWAVSPQVVPIGEVHNTVFLLMRSGNNLEMHKEIRSP